MKFTMISLPQFSRLVQIEVQKALGVKMLRRLDGSLFAFIWDADEAALNEVVRRFDLSCDSEERPFYILSKDNLALRDFKGETTKVRLQTRDGILFDATIDRTVLPFEWEGM